MHTIQHIILTYVAGVQQWARNGHFEEEVKEDDKRKRAHSDLRA